MNRRWLAEWSRNRHNRMVRHKIGSYFLQFMTSRRRFLIQAGAAGAVVSSPVWSPASAQIALDSRRRRSAPRFRLGIAGYTFNKFKLEPTLEMLRKVDVHFLCIKDFHLPLESTVQEIADFHAKCQASEVTGYGVGPIYMGTEEEVKKSFAYAKRVGVRTLVGVPYKRVDKQRVASPDLLRLVHDQVQEYDIRYAIHNHGPDMPELFPNAESAMELIQNLDPRVGLCLDIGHQFRDGKDPVRAMTDFADRIFDIHLKNVTSPDKTGRAAELPRGAIDLPAFFSVVHKVQYSGVCSLEYEKDMDNPLTGIAECVGYFRGLLDATSGAPA